VRIGAIERPPASLVRVLPSDLRDRFRMRSGSSDASPAPFSVARRRLWLEAEDPRADDRRRLVDLARDRIVIRRMVAGVAMTIRVPAAAYRGVALRLTGFSDGGFRYDARLLHRDPDLSVCLSESDDQAEIEAQWRLWARFFSLPALVQRNGAGEPERFDAPHCAIRPVISRRRGKATTMRRARFLVRRKVGRIPLASPPHADALGSVPGIEF
jgi:hypothetical protein